MEMGKKSHRAAKSTTMQPKKMRRKNNNCASLMYSQINEFAQASVV